MQLAARESIEEKEAPHVDLPSCLARVQLHVRPRHLRESEGQVAQFENTYCEELSVQLGRACA